MGSMLSLNAQKFITKNGVIEIISETPVYTFKGINKKVGSTFDAEIGEIVASTLIRSFNFEEAIVEERFSGTYIDPEEHPKSTFQGRITDYKKIDFTKDGSYGITIEGKLTINGVTNYIKEQGLLTLKNENLFVKIEITVSLEAYEISGDRAYDQDKVLLKIQFNYQPYSN
jgi:DUF917 family protein